MRKLTLGALYAEYGEGVLNKQSTRRNPIWDKIDELEVNEALVIERSEWPIKNSAAQAVNDHYKKLGRKFTTRSTKERVIIARTA